MNSQPNIDISIRWKLLAGFAACFFLPIVLLELHLPLWGAPMEALLTRLFKEGPSVHISATRIRGVAVGEPYDRMLVDTLPVGVDPMGETGEFHTVVSGRLRAPLEAIAG